VLVTTPVVTWTALDEHTRQLLVLAVITETSVPVALPAPVLTAMTVEVISPVD